VPSIREGAVRKLFCFSLVMILLPSAESHAGWPFFSDGPRRGTPEYLEMRAGDPPGRRQFYYGGKFWPDRPRPTGEDLPWLHTYHATHYWPHPYVCQDRAIVNAFSSIQVNNGWVEATTFFDYHFDADSNQLNHAGKQHLQWILSQVPMECRTPYLAQSFDPTVNISRVAAMEQEMAVLVGPEHSLPVLLRVASPSPRNASELNSIYQLRSTNILPPIITYSTDTGSGGTE
jgi:hypothetical protein